MEKSVERIIDELKIAQPIARSELNMVNPLQTLVAVMLSAQCRDATVNKVTPTLFGRYQTVEDFAIADLDELRGYLNKLTLYKGKSSNIIALSKILVKKHDSRVPADYDKLVALPGIGPKSANVIMQRFGKTSGFVVDTHVKRVSYRLGLTTEKDPEKVRAVLETAINKELWNDTADRLILHGRYTCKARSPNCTVCQLETLCPKVDVK